MQRRRGQRGFTLVEVMVVVVIVGTLAAIAIPLFSRDLPRRYLKATTRDLYSAIMRAKSEAIMRQMPVAVRINPKKSEFKDLEADDTWKDDLTNKSEISYVMFTVPQGGSVKKEQVPVANSQFIEKNLLPSGVVFVQTPTGPPADKGPGMGSSLYYHTVVFDARGIPQKLDTSKPQKSAQGCITLCAAQTRTGKLADLSTCRTIKIAAAGAVSIMSRLPDVKFDAVCFNN